jgi:putative FmdB family regulatory protein
MPIYAYRCESCGHAKDVLQKMSDPVLSTCPACGAESFKKQVTAAGFQLKGSGWYVTDFRGGSGGASAPATAASTAGAAAGTDSAAAPSAAAPSAPASDSASSSSGGDGGAAGCGSSCACH